MSYLSILSLYLHIIGPTGIIVLLCRVWVITWHFRDSPLGGFRRHQRSLYLKQTAGLALLFLLAMAASYALLHEVWGVLYGLLAFKACTWWVRLALLP